MVYTSMIAPILLMAMEMSIECDKYCEKLRFSLLIVIHGQFHSFQPNIYVFLIYFLLTVNTFLKVVKK